MKSVKTSRHRKSATRQITKKKSVRKQQKRHNHHSRKRTKTRRHRRQRGGDYSIPTDETVDGEPIATNHTIVTTSDGKTVSAKQFLNPSETDKQLGISYPDI